MPPGGGMPPIPLPPGGIPDMPPPGGIPDMPAPGGMPLIPPRPPGGIPDMPAPGGIPLIPPGRPIIPPPGMPNMPPCCPLVWVTFRLYCLSRSEVIWGSTVVLNTPSTSLAASSFWVSMPAVKVTRSIFAACTATPTAFAPVLKLSGTLLRSVPRFSGLFVIMVTKASPTMTMLRIAGLDSDRRSSIFFRSGFTVSHEADGPAG